MMGATIPIAVIIATVDDPWAVLMSIQMKNARGIRLDWTAGIKSWIVKAIPVWRSTWPNVPPAAVIRIMMPPLESAD